MSVDSTELFLKGVSNYQNVTIGSFFYLEPKKEERLCSLSVKGNLDEEVNRYEKAVKASVRDIKHLQKQLKKEKAFEGVAILDSHLELLQDPMMTTAIIDEVRQTKQSSLFILNQTLNLYREKFNALTDPFFKERFKDIQDVADRVVTHLKHKTIATSYLKQGTVIFAYDLTPSQVAALKPSQIVGIVTKGGGPTSHSAIIAKSKGIPFISNVEFPSFLGRKGQKVIVDGIQGVVIVNPQVDRLSAYTGSLKSVESTPQGDGTAVTEDGHCIHLFLNVDYLSEVKLSKSECSGVGLFRTEFLMNHTFRIPKEEEQFQIYKSLVNKFEGLPVVIRAFDFGGEKGCVSQSQIYEHNPSLGYRAVRLLLKEEALFHAQLRAILRVSSLGDVRFLLPMISSIEELRECKERIFLVQNELEQEGIAFERTMPIGCMIEVPSAALIADHLAKECDFLSFGTNDLAQYTLAVDRSNHLISHVYSPLHPGFLRMLHKVIGEARKAKKPLSICGEIASDPRIIPILIGMGLTSFSLSQHTFGMVREVIQQQTFEHCSRLAKEVLEIPSQKEIEKFLEARLVRSRSSITAVKTYTQTDSKFN